MKNKIKIIKKKKDLIFIIKTVILCNNSLKNNKKIMPVVRINEDTKKILENIEIELFWLKLNTPDEKIKHLAWFYNNFEKKFDIKANLKEKQDKEKSK